MKAKLINETTVKITVSMTDLEERGMELADFIVPQEKTEDFFYTMLEEVELPETFKFGGMLSFRVTPKKDRVDIFVTKSDLDTGFDMEDLSYLDDLSELSRREFYNNIEKVMTRRGDKKALERLAEAEAKDELESGEALDEPRQEVAYMDFILSFVDFNDLIAFSKNLSFPVEVSELYKYQNKYHLALLFDIRNMSEDRVNMLYAHLLEFAQTSTESRAFLLEHGILLRSGEIVEELAQLSEV